MEREAAVKRKAATQAKPGEKVGQGGAKLAPPADKGKSRDKVAAAVGMSGETYRKAKAVVEAAEQDPKLRPVIAATPVARQHAAQSVLPWRTSHANKKPDPSTGFGVRVVSGAIQQA